MQPQLRLLQASATRNSLHPGSTSLFIAPTSSTRSCCYGFHTKTRAMASATSFYDFKPLDSTSDFTPAPFISILRTKNHRSRPLLTIPFSFLSPPHQKKANPTRSPISKTKSSSWSTRPRSAVSRRSSKAWRRSTRKSRRPTRTDSSSSASPATSSCSKTPATTTPSSPSA